MGKETIESKQGTGSALENLNRRLISLFNDNAALKFETSEKGTIVSCILPFKFERSKQMNVLIVDDEPYAVDELKYLTEKSRYVDTIMEADNIKDAFGLIIQYSMIWFSLDIHLANEDGLELADKIQNACKSTIHCICYGV